MSRTKQQLLQASNQVKNETQEGANTANRIGGILYDITEHIGDGGGGDSLNTPLKEINSAGIGAGSAKQFIGKDNNNNPAWLGSEDILNPILDDLNNSNISPNASSKALGKSSIGTWTWMEVSGGGGGEGDDPKKIGTQITYFLNLNKGVNAEKPLINEYNSDTDTFTHVVSSGNQVWKRTDAGRNINTQDTWQIWVWFENDVPQYINGPVNMTAGGTNGADSNEREFIYFRTANELVDDAIIALSNYFYSCVGAAQAKNDKTFQDEDAVPLDSLGYLFTDQAQGVDDADNRYEYEAYRDSVLNSNGKRVWGIDSFHGPYLRSSYGKEGQDGDGVEYIFYASQAGIAPILGGVNDPSIWINDPRYNKYTKDGVEHTYQEDEYIYNQSDWMDDPADLDSVEYGQGSKQWVSIRKKRVPEGETDAIWESYSEPKLWSGVGSNGIVDGYITSATNATMPVTTDEDGNIPTFSDTCGFDVFHNGTRVNYGSSEDNYSISVNTADIVCPQGSGINVNTLTSISNTGIITVSFSNALDMAGKHISIPVVLHLPDSTTRTHVITVICIKSNKGGESINVYTSSSVIRTDYYHQNAVPSSLQIGVRIGSGSVSNVYLSSISDAEGTAESMGWHFKYYYGQFTQESDYTWQRGPITVDPLSRETTYSILTVRMYYGELDETHGKIPAFIEEQSLPYVIDGAPGIGTVNYSIPVIKSTAKAQTVDNAVQVTGSVSFKLLKAVGGTMTEITESNPFTEGETVYATVVDTPVTPYWDSNDNCWKINCSHAYNTNNPCIQIYVETETYTVVASVVIPILRDGDDATQGLNAVVMRFRSYNAIVSGSSATEPGDGMGNIQNGRFTSGDGVIYMDVVLFDGAHGDNEYYRVAETFTGTCDKAWAIENLPASGGVVGNNWVIFNRTSDAAFTALLAKYAFVENLTAREIVVTDTNGNPVAGMTQGTAVAGDYTASLVPQNVRGNVRIWAGYDSTTGNLTNSKFYVTDEGFVHAEGELYTQDESVNLFSTGESYSDSKGLQIKTAKDLNTTAELVSTNWGGMTGGKLEVRSVDTGSDSIQATSKVEPGLLAVYDGTAVNRNLRAWMYALEDGGHLSIQDGNAQETININGHTGTIACNNVVGLGGSVPVAMYSNLRTTETVVLPSNPTEGMFVFCTRSRNISADTDIYSSSGENWGTSVQDDKSRPRIFVYDGSVWREFYCG